jgi:lipopolysaccharide export system protein LptC
MADTALSYSAARSGGRDRFGGLVSAGDRAKAFRAAKRHSARVKVLRLLLPIAAVCMAGLYLWPSTIEFETEAGKASIDDIQVSGDGLRMVNPRIQGVHEKHGVYDIRADHATQQASNPELITLNTITAELTSKDGQKTVLTAPSGLFHSKKEELTFDNGLTIGGNRGYAGKLKTATAFFQSNKLITTDPVDLAYGDSTIQAQSMTLFSSEGRAIFEGNVKVHLERAQETNRQ